jgi:hypothetical protein
VAPLSSGSACIFAPRVSYYYDGIQFKLSDKRCEVTVTVAVDEKYAVYGYRARVDAERMKRRNPCGTLKGKWIALPV